MVKEHIQYYHLNKPGFITAKIKLDVNPEYAHSHILAAVNPSFIPILITVSKPFSELPAKLSEWSYLKK